MKIVISLILAAIVFVLCDWLGLLGKSIKTIPDFVHIIFVTRDSDSGKPVEDVHVVCSRPMARSVCSERLTGVPGQTEITFGVFRVESASFLFSAEQGFSLGNGNEMTMSFIHPNYERKIMFVDDNILGRNRNQKITVDLVKGADQ
ncbi:MAG: hypothetical protein AAF387_07325 [Pseudomonadota bacterium]